MKKKEKITMLIHDCIDHILKVVILQIPPKCFPLVQIVIYLHI